MQWFWGTGNSIVEIQKLRCVISLLVSGGRLLTMSVMLQVVSLHIKTVIFVFTFTCTL